MQENISNTTDQVVYSEKEKTEIAIKIISKSVDYIVKNAKFLKSYKDDFKQDAFIFYLRNKDKIIIEDKKKCNYIFVICLNVVRKSYANYASKIWLYDEEEWGFIFDSIQEESKETFLREEKVLINTIYHIVNNSIAEGQKKVLNKRLFEDKEHQEIAEELGFSKSNSKTQTMRGIEMVRKDFFKRVEQQSNLKEAFENYFN